MRDYRHSVAKYLSIIGAGISFFFGIFIFYGDIFSGYFFITSIITMDVGGLALIGAVMVILDKKEGGVLLIITGIFIFIGIFILIEGPYGFYPLTVHFIIDPMLIIVAGILEVRSRR